MANITGVDAIVVELRAEKTNLTNQLRQVGAALSALAGLNGGSRVVAAASSRRGTRLSVAARRKISIAQKARWAQVKSNGAQVKVTATNGQSRLGKRMGAAARKRISLAQKARWAKIRARNKG